MMSFKANKRNFTADSKQYSLFSIAERLFYHSLDGRIRIILLQKCIKVNRKCTSLMCGTAWSKGIAFSWNKLPCRVALLSPAALHVLLHAMMSVGNKNFFINVYNHLKREDHLLVT
jgi:hypothetical protein